MKVYTITNSSINNYGAILQAFALQTKMKQFGTDAYVLRMLAPSKSKMQKLMAYLPDKHYTVKDKLEIRNSRKKYAKKIHKLNAFYEKNIQSLVCHSLKEASFLADSADVMIAGSDQIWSPNGHMLSAFTTLQFGSSHIKRYSYAASVGALQYDADSEKLMRTGLEKIEGISVRESSTVDLIQGLTDKKVIQNIDPTLLFDSSFWNNYAGDRIISDPYIFVYMLRPEPLTLAMAKRLSEKTGKELYVISNKILDGVNNITDAGIEDWLSYIKHADYVITNSFHGTAFSVLFKKQLLSVAVEGSGMRVADFLGGIGLQDRIASVLDDVDKIDSEIAWDSADLLLKKQRAAAETYLSGIVQSDNSTAPKKIELFNSKSKCCGCSACMNICPKGAISMQEDECGFLYPKIDEDKCVKCGMCMKVCAYQNTVTCSQLKSAYAGISTSEEIRAVSASGGAFASIATDFLKKGGVVVGSEMMDSSGGLKPFHRIIDSVNELFRLQSSKYAHSEIGYVYQKVKHLLNDGKRVLFSGTSCQIAGLKGYLQKEYENLFTIDIICHGVPSAKLMQGYQKMLEDRFHREVTNINFRDKRKGWGEKGFVSLRDTINASETKEVLIDPSTSSYYKLYLMGAAYRENCYTCPYTNCKKRPGDLTLGDFWGIEKVHPEFLTSNGGPWKREEGISCFLVNSEKGEQLLQKYGSLLELKHTSAEKITFRNKMLTRPTFYFSKRDTILKKFQEHGYAGVDRWFWKTYGTKIKAKNMWMKLPNGLRQNIKKIIRK